MAVFRTVGDTDAVHDFEFGADSTVRVWKTWLKKDTLMMQGRQRPDGQIELEIVQPPGGGHLTLKRVTKAS
jgi:hypothetical protein